MNTKRLIFCAVTVLCCLSGFAQRKQTTEKCVVDLDGITFGGQMTYSYIVDEDGEPVRDGALSIIVNNRENSFYENDYRNFKLVGNYKLNANFQKGLLHGPMTMNANFKGDVRNYLERKQGSLTWSFQGNFANGLPHGNFNIQYDGETPRKLTASFNKGVLVGQMKYLYWSKGLPYEGSYSMNAKGELHGKHGSMDFVNGVLVCETSSEYSTPPSLVELSRKYANKTITKDELEEQGIAVLKDSINLEDIIYDIILESGLIDFENHIKRWDFTTPNVKYYEYLKKESRFKNEEGFNLFCKEYCSSINKEYKSEIIVQDTTSGKYYIYGKYREYEFRHGNFYKYVTPKLILDGTSCLINITKEQYEKLKNAVHDARKQRAYSIYDIMEDFPIMGDNETILFGTLVNLNVNSINKESSAADFINENYRKFTGGGRTGYEPKNIYLYSLMKALDNNTTTDRKFYNIHLLRSEIEALSNFIPNITLVNGGISGSNSYSHRKKTKIETSLKFIQEQSLCEADSSYIHIHTENELGCTHDSYFENRMKEMNMKVCPINELGVYIDRKTFDDWVETTELINGQYYELVKDADSQEKERIDAKMSKIKQMLIPTETFTYTFDAVKGLPALKLHSLSSVIEEIPSQKELKKFGKIASYQILESPIGELNKIYVRVANKKGMTIDLKWDITKELDSQREKSNGGFDELPAEIPEFAG